MKINGYVPPNQASQTEQNRSQATDKASAAKSSTAAGSADVVTHLNQLPQNTSQDVDMKRVEELREAIRDGKLNMRADHIADALLKSLTDDI